jgi:hypothetical protein
MSSPREAVLKQKAAIALKRKREEQREEPQQMMHIHY